VSGIQSNGVIANAKHFFNNNQVGADHELPTIALKTVLLAGDKPT
jgi:beta-glucosidase-like glycosyl hydrolase